jgi:hypothetical protein
LERRCVPATITPTTFDDGGMGSGSLRDAVLQFNADTGTDDDIIQLEAGTYSLTIRNTGGRHETAGLTGDLNLNQTSHRWIIQGAGPSTIIDASQLYDRVFQIVNPGTQVVFQDLVIQGGLAQDDGTNGAVAGTTDALGGGIFNNSSDVTLDNVVLQNNRAQGGNGVHTGQSGYNARGGGLYSMGGSVTISDSTIANNRAVGGNGQVGFDAGSNTRGQTGGWGGSGLGGGVYISGGLLTLANATISANATYGGEGGIGGDGGPYGGEGGIGGEGGSGQGGGVYISGSLLTLANATISANATNGGGGGNGGNGAYADGGSGGSGLGGGVFYAGSALSTLTNVTISGNITISGGGGRSGGPGGSDGPGGLADGAGLHTQGILRTRDTMLARNTGSPDLAGNLGSLGHNLIGDPEGGSGFDPTDLLNVNPLLGPLQDDGGPTPTMALLPGSPALNAGDPSQLGTRDQRGVIRSGGVNIGAYQASATAFVVDAPATVTAGIPFDVTVTAVDPFGQVAVGYSGTVTFSTTDPDPGVVLPADYSFQPTDAGQVTLPGGVTLITPGDQMLTVMDTADNTITGSADLTVSAGPAPHGRPPPPSTAPARPGQSEAPAPSQPSASEVVGLEQWLASFHDGDYVWPAV